jgi:hypothetical protein
MGTPESNGQQIKVNRRRFRWSLNHRYGNYWRESEPPAIHILSDDEDFEVYYQLSQGRKGRCHLDIRKGFVEIPDQVQTPCYVPVPVWDDEKPTTKLVRLILDWCMNDEKEFLPTKVTVRSRTSDGGFREMIRKLDGLPALEEMYLPSTRISDTGIQIISNWGSLHTLRIEGGPITDVGLSCLESLCELKSLCLSEIKLTDDGLKHLRRCQNLELLWLTRTKVSDAGLDEIAGLKKLWYIDLSDTLVTDEGRKRLRCVTQAQVLPE